MDRLPKLLIANILIVSHRFCKWFFLIKQSVYGLFENSSETTVKHGVGRLSCFTKILGFAPLPKLVRQKHIGALIKTIKYSIDITNILILKN
ncbi:hypothetical protein [Neptuniibacter sp.]|uniref:hypothetical protein n=1 Tax=Neptuniibacter sp. TaxID=1962643 RepID=UPI00262FBBB9|nr:hypothetical protein [Neptuniibacter sp.]MCP4597003.1 hypothetical protein [Neptuniibacter sp.]